MIPGTTTYREVDETSKQAGGPHFAAQNAWNARTGGRRRGSRQPWATSPPEPKMTTVLAVTAPPLKSSQAMSSTAETDIASWQARMSGGTRGVANPNYTSAHKLANTIDLKSTIGGPIAEVSTPVGKCSTGNIDRHSWEARAKGNMGVSGGRGQADPWAATLTEAPRGGTAPLPLGATAGESKAARDRFNKTSTAAFDLSSWEQRLDGSGGRGVSAPNMRGLAAAQKAAGLTLTHPVPCEPKQGRRAFHYSSTAEADMSSWLDRISASQGVSTGGRGQHDPYAQTLTEGKARPGAPAGPGPGYKLTGVMPSDNKSGGWNFAGIFSSTAATDSESWQQRMNKTAHGQKVMANLKSTGVLQC